MSRTRKVQKTNRKRRTRTRMRKTRKKKGGSLFSRNASDKIKEGDRIKARNYELVKNLDLSDTDITSSNYMYTVQGTTWKKYTKYLRITTAMKPGIEFLILPSNASKIDTKTVAPPITMKGNKYETPAEAAQRIAQMR